MSGGSRGNKLTAIGHPTGRLRYLNKKCFHNNQRKMKMVAEWVKIFLAAAAILS
jgi:hypothetical protein